MSITDKFSKKIEIVPGKKTHSAAEWATKLIERCFIGGLGQPAVIISDQDRKFAADLWEGMFNELGTRLIMTTVYHPSADGQAERSNQTIEVALRHLFFTNTDAEKHWPAFCPLLQTLFNNSPNTSTGQSPNEVILGFNTNEGNPVLQTQVTDDLVAMREVNRRQAADAVTYAAAKMKQHYDHNHKAIDFDVGDYVFINLKDSYKIQALKDHPKFRQQRVGPFKVIEKVNPLAYRLELPDNMRIDSVVSVTHLEKAPDPDQDPYQRTHDPNPPPVEYHEGGDAYEIEAILKHRTRKVGKGRKQTAYSFLCKWRGWGPEAATWEREESLDNCPDILAAYKQASRLA